MVACLQPVDVAHDKKPLRREAWHAAGHLDAVANALRLHHGGTRRAKSGKRPGGIMKTICRCEALLSAGQKRTLLVTRRWTIQLPQ